jgi:hypothetical protein
MSQPQASLTEHFHLREGYASFDPVGVVSLEKAVALVDGALIFARDNNIRLLLIDATGLSGFPSPSVADRYWIVRQWAADSKNRVEVAIVMQRRLIDPDRFGVQVAINLGMRADVFETRGEALAWLLSGADPQPLAAAKTEKLA